MGAVISFRDWLASLSTMSFGCPPFPLNNVISFFFVTEENSIEYEPHPIYISVVGDDMGR